MHAPCKDCPEREIGCHARCEKYQEYVKAKAAAKAREKADKAFTRSELSPGKVRELKEKARKQK